MADAKMKMRVEIAEPKPGTKTTEFWVTLALLLVGKGLIAYGIYKSSEPAMGIGGIVIALAGGTYNRSRGQAKSGRT